MKYKTSDKGFDAMMGGGMPHPLNIMSMLGSAVNPSFFPTEFNGRPAGYNMGSLGAQAVTGRTPGGSGGGSTQQPTPSNSFQWSFPQYSQSWAFTPPGAQTYSGPPPLTGGSPTALPKPSTPAPTKASPALNTPFSIDSLRAKYMR